MRAVLWTAFALSTILLAALVGFSTLLLPYAGKFRTQAAAWLGEKLGEPVAIESLAGRWQGPGPQFILKNLTIGSGDDALVIESAELNVDIMAWLRPGSSLSQLYLLTDRIDLTRDESGGWSVSGLPARGQGNWQSVPLDLGFRAREIRVSDPTRNIELTLPQVEVSLLPQSGGIQLSGEVDFDQAGTAEFTLHTGSEPGLSLYLAASNVALQRWLAGSLLGGAQVVDGILDGELWLRWAGGRVSELTFDGSISKLVLGAVLPAADGALDTRFSLDSLEGLLQFVDDGKSKALALSNSAVSSKGEVWPASDLMLRLDDSGHWSAQAGYLDLGDLAHLLTSIDLLPMHRRLALYDHGVTGRLSSLSLSGSGSTAQEIDGGLKVDSLSWLDHGSLPGVAGLAAEARLADGKLLLDLDAEPGALLSAPQVFRQPLPLDRLTGRVEVDLAAPQLTIASSGLDLQIGSAVSQARFELAFNGGRPFVDIHGWVSEGQVREASRFWPHRKFKPNLIQWLDRALVDGEVRSGAMVLYGDLDQWPFSGEEGRFEARAIVENGVLDFHPDWPAADRADVDLRFDARGLSAQAPRARFGNLAVGPVRVGIDDYRNPVVNVDVASDADASDLLRFLRRTPIYAGYAPYVDGLTAAGPTTSEAMVRFPLRPDLGEVRVTGEVALAGVDLAESAWDLQFDNSSGLLAFSTDGLLAEGISTHWKQAPATLRLATGALVNEPVHAVEIMLQGAASASDFVERVPVLEPVLRRIPEASLWTAELTADLPAAGLPPDKVAQSAQLTLRSNLRSSALTLPAPLDKARGEVLPVSISMTLPETETLSLDVGKLLALRINNLADDGRWAGTLHFGAGAPRPNAEPGLLIEGAIETLDVDGWRALIDELIMSPDASQRWLTSLDLSVAKLRYAERDFTNLTLRTSRDENYWTLNLLGDQFDGRMRLPLTVDTNRLLLAEFERFVWPLSTSSMASPEFHPSVIPPLRFVAESLQFHDVEYGRVSFETYPTRDGMHIDELETRSDVMQVSATGDWEKNGDAHSSNFAITITGDDLGQILSNFGFSELFDGGQTFVRLDALWDGAPSEFEMARLGGDLDVRITSGQIMEVEPGAGRIFGLISLQAVPRRLQLDFSDLFKSGLTFDAIEGNFLLEKGDAYTDNLTIRGPTANIAIQGRAGLAAQDYDQVITVIPEVGSTLPLVGALAGGGAGAAAAFLLQNMFGRQIDRISQFHYSVTGTWEDPDVELIGADDRKLELETARLMRRRFEEGAAQPQ